MIRFGKLATIEIALWDFLMLTEWAFFSDCVMKTISDFPLLWLHNACTCQEHACVHTYYIYRCFASVDTYSAIVIFRRPYSDSKRQNDPELAMYVLS